MPHQTSPVSLDALQASLASLHTGLGLGRPAVPVTSPTPQGDTKPASDPPAVPKPAQVTQATPRPPRPAVARTAGPATPQASPGDTTYYADNKARIRAQQAKYRETNRDAILARRRAAAAKDRAAVAASNAKHYEAHREAILARRREAYAADPGARAAINARYLAKKKAAAAQG